MDGKRVLYGTVQLLTTDFWAQLMAPPSSDREVAMYCTLSPDELEAIAKSVPLLPVWAMPSLWFICAILGGFVM